MKCMVRHYFSKYGGNFTEIAADRVSHGEISDDMYNAWTSMFEDMVNKNCAKKNIFRGNVEYTTYNSARDFTTYTFYENKPY